MYHIINGIKASAHESIMRRAIVPLVSPGEFTHLIRKMKMVATHLLNHLRGSSILRVAIILGLLVIILFPLVSHCITDILLGNAHRVRDTMVHSAQQVLLAALQATLWRSTGI